MVTKKASPKKATKKQVKTPVKKPTKKAVKKPAKKLVADKKTVTVKAVTDSTGVVTMKSVDDPGTASEGKAASVKATVDKETGVVVMVPESDED